MANVKIFTDSAADIPTELVKELDISVIPIKLHMKGETFLDGQTISADQFYAAMRQTKEIPTTSQPSPHDFYTAFEKALNEQEDAQILSIHISSAVSGTYQAAMLAKSMLEDQGDRVTVVDSRSATYALGIMVVAAARLAKEGKSIHDCHELIQYYVANQKVFFMVDTLEYLQKGGRIGKAAAVLGSLLNITPILSLNEAGEVYVLDKVRGKKKAIERVFELMKESIPPASPVSVGVMHGDDEKGALGWLQRIGEIYEINESMLAPLGPAIGTHAGPGTLACVLVPIKSTANHPKGE